MNAEKKIYTLFVVSILLTIVSFVIPRFTANPDGGFAAATTAALSFLISLGVTLAVYIYMLVFTINNSNKVSTTARIVGIVPSIILAIGLIGLIIFVSLG